MGISGLLPALKSITRRGHISEYKDKVVLVDGYCWMHRSIYMCAEDVAEGKVTDRYIDFMLSMVDVLTGNNVQPIIVFDGAPLPIKSQTNLKRSTNRKQYIEEARRSKARGDSIGAYTAYQKAAPITTEMVYRVILALKARQLRFIVAPYESDAQIGYLLRKGYADAVLTEDSDLLLYGCPVCLFKFNKDGSFLQVSSATITACTDYNFQSWTPEMFRHMCILSGCDYLQSIKGLGIKKSYKLISTTKRGVMAIQSLRMTAALDIPINYEENFIRADQTFLYQRVFDPETKTMSHVTPLPEQLQGIDTSFLGPPIADRIAVYIADGDLNPITLEPFNEQLAFSSDGRKIVDKYRTTSAVLFQPPSAYTKVDKKVKGVDQYFNRIIKTSGSNRPSTKGLKRLPKELAFAAIDHNLTANTFDTDSTNIVVKKSKFFISSSPSQDILNVADNVNMRFLVSVPKTEEDNPGIADNELNFGQDIYSNNHISTAPFCMDAYRRADPVKSPNTQCPATMVVKSASVMSFDDYTYKGNLPGTDKSSKASTLVNMTVRHTIKQSNTFGNCTKSTKH